MTIITQTDGKNMKEPILSICIPTFNRYKNLAHTLESIVTADSFGDEVEVVISDNASTDDTAKVAQDYASRYPNIHYFKNKENVRDSNFTLALDRGTGEYKQLMNDNRLIGREALTYMLGAVKKHLVDRIPLYFLCGNIFNADKNKDELECHSLDDFLIHVSYFSTAIWAFGAWKEDWDSIDDKMRYSKLQLCQEDWFFQVVKKKQGCVLMLKEWSKSESFGVKRGYNLFQVHIDNYYTIMKPYITDGFISKKAYHTDQRIQLRRIKYMLVSACLCDVMPDNVKFDLSGARLIIWKNFKNLPYFYWYLLTGPIWAVRIILWKKIIERVIK